MINATPLLGSGDSGDSVNGYIYIYCMRLLNLTIQSKPITVQTETIRIQSTYTLPVLVTII